MTASVDGSTRVVGVLSAWDSEAEHLDASNSAPTKTREEGQNMIGGAMTVESSSSCCSKLLSRHQSARRC